MPIIADMIQHSLWFKSGTNNYSSDIPGTQIGNATIYRANGDPSAQAIGFTLWPMIIMEKLLFPIVARMILRLFSDYLNSKDVGNGWLLGTGNHTVPQAVMALGFIIVLLEIWQI